MLSLTITFSNTFSVFAERFNLVSASPAHNTRSSSKDLLFIPSYNTSRFGRKSVICSATLIWNHLQNKYSKHDFMKLAPKALKNLLTQKLISLPSLVFLSYFLFDFCFFDLI